MASINDLAVADDRPADAVPDREKQHIVIARSETLLVITNLLGSCVFKTTFPSTNQLSALIERIQHGISESGLAGNPMKFARTTESSRTN